MKTKLAVLTCLALLLLSTAPTVTADHDGDHVDDDHEALVCGTGLTASVVDALPSDVARCDADDLILPGVGSDGETVTVVVPDVGDDRTVPAQSTPGVDGQTVGVDDQTVSETCDPAELLICIGPVNVPGQSASTPPVDPISLTPAVTVQASLSGTNATLSDVGATTPVGPIHEEVSVAGITVPVTLCPSTCPVPVTPDGRAQATLHVAV